MSTAHDPLVRWARYYRAEAEAVRARDPQITAGVLKTYMHTHYGPAILIDAVVDRMFGIGAFAS
jgi:hypothetical protein